MLEHFLWLTQEESTALTSAGRLVVKEELADVFICLVRLSDVMGIDLYAAAESRMGDNERRYPTAKAGGRAKKDRACKA